MDSKYLWPQISQTQQGTKNLTEEEQREGLLQKYGWKCYVGIVVPMDMILRFNILKRAHWCFDFPNKKWGITQLLVNE